MLPLRLTDLGAWLVRRLRTAFRRPADPSPAKARARYRAAVDALPDDQRRVFLLHRVEDLSIVAIAARLEMTTAEVERALGEALRSIGRAIERP